MSKMKSLMISTTLILSLLFVSFGINAATIRPVYCDTSAGRIVLNDGDYSKSYCRFNAVMDLQNIHECCTWQGGVLLVRLGQVICRDGSVSPICSIQEEKDNKYMYSDDSVEIKNSSFLN